MEKVFQEIAQKEKLAYINDDLKAKTAPDVVRVLDKHLDFDSVFDFGCGTGVYKRAFEATGKVTTGIDGNPDANPEVLADLRRLQYFMPRDLVFSIEVAEHIEPEYEHIFITNLKRHSFKWIVMTADPGKKKKSEYTRVAHVNEKPRGHWIKAIIDERYPFDGVCLPIDSSRQAGVSWEYKKALSETVQQEMRKTKGMMRWFFENLMIFQSVY